MTRPARQVPAYAIAVIVFALLACKSSQQSSGAGSATAAPVGVAPAPGAAADVSAEKMGTFVCKDIQSDACIGATERFAADAPVVHVSYKTKDLPKNGDVYTIRWIAEDVGEAAKPNTVIASLEKKVEDVPSFGLKHYVVNSQLSKPTAGWPVGKYLVEIKLGDKVVTSARFEIG